ncbi:MAG: UDP-N-acetylglucosamine 1-carboxyvinyltransferase [Clostridia bacterium]|nr:UDP-N-acetylglucosamine 1-carboxyvinyltransferase [Clostridia bacterium]
MHIYKINGGKPLNGFIEADGAKNAALPIIAASILTDEVCLLGNIPQLKDVENMIAIAKHIGSNCSGDNANCLIRIETSKIVNSEINYNLAGKLRASFLFAGAMLAVNGYVKIAMPGGCDIGLRPIDLHLKGFSLMGAAVVKDGGFVTLEAPDGLCGAEIYLDFPSVGATENIMIAATAANGTTTIKNAAAEPEIVDLANFLCEMGAEITGAGSDNIEIKGRNKMHGTIYNIVPDRIEAGTYMAAAGAAGGDVTIKKVNPVHLEPVTLKLREAGIYVEEGIDYVRVVSGGRGSILPIDIRTLPYPGFPTDMQAQMAAFLTQASGTSLITETIFENRFQYVGELNRLGAVIKLNERTAVVSGTDKKENVFLTGTAVEATDLRGGAALVIAALSAKGETCVSNVEFIERGYRDITGKLSSLGADIISYGNC